MEKGTNNKVLLNNTGSYIQHPMISETESHSVESNALQPHGF